MLAAEVIILDSPTYRAKYNKSRRESTTLLEAMEQNIHRRNHSYNYNSDSAYHSSSEQLHHQQATPPPIPQRSPLQGSASETPKLKVSSERLGDYFFGGTGGNSSMTSLKEDGGAGGHGDELSLPTWSANPQSAEADADELHAVGGSSNSSSGCGSGSRRFRVKRILCSWGLLLFVIVGIASYTNSRSKLNKSLEEVTSLMTESQRTDLQIKLAEKNVRKLQRELAALNMMDQQKKKQGSNSNKGGGNKNGPDPSSKVVEEYKTMQDRLRLSAQKAETLKERVQSTSKHDIISKWGLGPHHVEIELVFPSNLDGHKKFVLEMAPIDLMPHSVHTFMEMAAGGLLDGCSFILNALHVLKAAPLPYDTATITASEKARAFTKSGLESVAFREYSHDYPHYQYTVGFAADGSPSFYINTEDNSEIHAGDPCFAKVVSGIEAVKRLEASPTRNGIWFEKRIGIKKATILGPSKEAIKQ